jgi:tRNA1(Val) A37 N6-methylase TrmN6
VGKLKSQLKCKETPTQLGILNFLPKRVLMEFVLHQQTPEKETLTIETNQRHIYTTAYQNLTKDFYLEF